MLQATNTSFDNGLLAKTEPIRGIAMRDFKSLLLLAIFVGVLSVMSAAQAQVIFSADFQTDVPGTIPAAVAISQQNGTNRIVTTTAASEDPFGIAGNQSMKLSDFNNIALGYRAVIPFGETFPTSYSDVTIEMDMILANMINGWTATNMFIGDTLGNGAQWFADGLTAQIFPAVNSGGIGSVGQIGGIYSQSAPGGGGVVITENVPFRLKFVTNSATSSYRVFVNGTQLGWNFGDGTVYDVPAGSDTVNQITFTSEGLGLVSVGDVFVDNIVVSLNSSAVENADFNGDGIVDGADFVIWQRGLGVGSSLETGDANADAAVDGQDLAIWSAQFGPVSSASTFAAGVPEPAGMVLLACAAAGMLPRTIRGVNRKQPGPDN
ncbi:MAG TPA: hypothetical protein PKC18_18210 [Lacipirellulaceae bacterium]|nr:hypothetical protein [Lacipirellulaceae bacterium]HMP04877.1 hypothetical protein [Lacipirellulaceae bacterium]